MKNRLRNEENHSSEQHKHSLKRQIGRMAVLIILLILSIIVFILQYQRVNTMMNDERGTYIYEVAEKIAEQISATLNHLNNEASVLPGILEKSDAVTFQDCGDLFKGALTRGNILLVTNEGELFRLSGERTTISNRKLLLDVIVNQKSSFSYETGAEQEDYWVFCYPCKEKEISGHKINAVIMAYPAQNFADEFSLQLFKETGYALLSDDLGAIRLRPSGESWIGYNIFSSLSAHGVSDKDVEAIQSSFLSGKVEERNIFVNNERWLVHSEKLSDTTLGKYSNLLVMNPIEVITKRVNRGMRGAIYSALVVSVIVLLIVFSLIWFMKRTSDERKREEEKSKVEIALRAAEAKNDFLARMSHDIRTPLNAIIGLNYIEGQNINNPVVLSDCNRKLGASADYLLQILNDVLDMSKISSGKLTIAHVPFAMEDVLYNLKTMIAPRAEEKNIIFTVKAPDHFQSSFTGDRLRLTQILMNLLTNSVKFTPSGGRVSLICKVEETGLNHCKMTFSVSDTGIGMSKEYLSKLFTPFEQEDTFTAEKYGGSGLGLSIVHSLVTMMDGEISVQSIQGKGSVFTVSIPFEESTRTKEESINKVAASVNSDILKGKHILLAEDNLINQQIAITILDSMEITVTPAENGKIALDKFLAAPPHTFDVIISDIRMPVMDGYAFADAVRSSNHPEAAVVPIVALSANAFEEDIEESLKHGMNAHLRKPIDVEEVRTTLIHLLETNSKSEN